jgi:hypoxanthine phosphoribosyltransferase
VAGEINREMRGKQPLFLVVLNGAFMFAADLLKEITAEGAGVTFTRLASYEGTASTGQVRELVGVDGEIAGRNVVIVEDVVDSGRSLAHLLETLAKYQPKSVKVAALFYKPNALVYDVAIDYMGIALENDFVVGYGLDYDGLGRNLPSLYTLVP